MIKDSHLEGTGVSAIKLYYAINITKRSMDFCSGPGSHEGNIPEYCSLEMCEFCY